MQNDSLQYLSMGGEALVTVYPLAQYEQELLIIGNGVGRGYMGKPELTAEKFVSFKGWKAYHIAATSPNGTIMAKSCSWGHGQPGKTAWTAI